ncbi:putative leucine-rich repeat domain superfamily [Helianthus annuus]|nr:putative leucine-rich repeat domain superfamily [Helianthus annuus]
MLLQIGELKSLQITLSKIILESENEDEISELKGYKNLCGKISIVGLEKVQNKIHAHKANFSEKRLSELELVWSDEQYDSRNERLEKEVLNELKPCDDKLTRLKIRSYGGLEFPKWVADPLFLHLKHVTISGCKRCTSLPPLAQLPSLKELFIEGLYGVEVVGFELSGSSCTFPSLEVMSFEDMRGWKKWYGVVFPCLQKLKIKDCPNLVEVTIKTLPSLTVLEIDGCPYLVKLSLEALPSLNVMKLVRCDCGVLKSLVQVASAISKLEIHNISGLNDVVWRGVLEHLGVVEELIIFRCNEIRHLWESKVVASKVLVKLWNLLVVECRNLVSLGEKEEGDNCTSNLLTSLRILKVVGCDNMERCNCPDGIKELTVSSCRSITTVSFPKGGHEKLRSLEISDCAKLLEMEWGGQKMNNNRSNMLMLEDVCISEWPNLKSIIELNYLVHLTTLTITDCERLESFPDNLTTLKKLEITICPSLDVSFPGWVWPPSLRSLTLGKLKKPFSEWGPQTFPTSLVKLKLYEDDEVSSCSEFSHLLPSSLTSLQIHGFEKLESFSVGLQHLTYLQTLSFLFCPNLKKVSHPQHLTFLQHLSFKSCHSMIDLGEMLLPSLLSLTIISCQKLYERYSERGCSWSLISHIPLTSVHMPRTSLSPVAQEIRQLPRSPTI